MAEILATRICARKEIVSARGLVDHLRVFKIRHPGFFVISLEKLTKHSGAERKLEEYLQEVSNL